MESDLTTKEQVGIGVGIVGAVSLVGILGFFYYEKWKNLSNNSNSTLQVDSDSRAPEFQVNKLPGNINYAVGMYNRKYSGWRQATQADWTNPTIQKELVEANQKDGGWPLLEEPLICNDVLWVTEGTAKINNQFVNEVGFNWGQQLQGVYSAMNSRTQVAWTTTAPALGNNWTVESNTIKLNPPCLFINVYTIAVGKYNNTYSGYHRATGSDWTNNTFKEELLKVHRENEGLPLLEAPLHCNLQLFVSDGWVLINNNLITETGFNTAQQLINKYSATYMNPSAWGWELQEPSINDTWTIHKYKATMNPPCLFIRDAWKYGGRSKQTHRYKRSRKQKKD